MKQKGLKIISGVVFQFALILFFLPIQNSFKEEISTKGSQILN